MYCGKPTIPRRIASAFLDMTLTADIVLCSSDATRQREEPPGYLAGPKWAANKVRLLEATIPHHPIAADPD
ncbi:hypothetical protein J7T55_013290 [Diaporthe amygdali]|uniref:uncharacterized protein n=1 Tax=Phomopsis amygdali TaxID=1214568 RepID=UPI0022FF1B08|nr:uncharacterized protein J7T55_013290 [Diaporthe amygdali]KAJ0119055.1 hypothetical protein J7T55_013290 [Diaporthe amygdali]